MSPCANLSSCSKSSWLRVVVDREVVLEVPTTEALFGGFRIVVHISTCNCLICDHWLGNGH